tara:strand:+ start:2326 stop:2898 length:573 start_codon:yes stop_codon:yes gene_type:complete
MPKIESAILRNIFSKALESFLSSESQNIVNGTSERNLCARLAMFLEAGAASSNVIGYYADAEYNRKQKGKVKTILDDNMVEIPITCDLILHSRGEFILEDNLIAIEMKRSSHSEKATDADRRRLRAMTKSSFDDIWSADGIAHPEHVCGYRIGYLLVLNVPQRNIVIEEYESGKFIKKYLRHFRVFESKY